MDSSTSVDTLVYQLEDDDAAVRWDTLQRLRKRAAVERAQLPVRNPRRFLHCLRRRLGDDDPRIARETLLLLVDVVDVLRDDVDQILASVLPHLVPRLPGGHSDGASRNDMLSSPLHEETFQVFRKYVNVTSDLAGVADLLVNHGLAHARAAVREAALVALVRLLDERFGRRAAAATARKATARVDATLFTQLTQAIVPTLEDSDEGVVVAAEEAVAKIQLFWGKAGFQDVMQFLSSEDKATLHAHAVPINEFLHAATADPSMRSSVSASQVLKLRASLPVAPLAVTTPLRFGFVAADVMTVLNTNAGNSNAEWKKRTSAVEQLYATAKLVDSHALRVAASVTAADPMDELMEILVRLLQDIDVHLVKRSLQILRLVFLKLELLDGDDAEDTMEDDASDLDVYAFVKRILPALVETAANYVEDEEISTQVYALLQTLFGGTLVTAAGYVDALISSLRHRRLQVREEALRVWMVLLLTAHSHTASVKGVLSEHSLDALGKALGDGGSRVRYMAMETAAVLAAVTRQDVCAIVEHHLDDFMLERVDLDALYGRLRDKQLPVLLGTGRLRMDADQQRTAKASNGEVMKASHTRTPVQTGGAQTRDDSSGKAPMRVSNGASLGVSELQRLDSPPDVPAATYLRQSAAVNVKHRIDDRRLDGNVHTGNFTQTHEDDGNEGRGVSADQVRPSESQRSTANVQRDVTSAPAEPIADKLLALKRKTEQLRKSASSKQVLHQERHFNPQEGDCDFASAGYAAQQQPPPRHQPSRANTKTPRGSPEAGDDVVLKPVKKSSQAFQSPREEEYATPPYRQVEELLGSRYTHESGADGDAPASPSSFDDRPIRPMRHGNFDEFAPADAVADVPAKRKNVAMSLATKKRLEAKQRAEQENLDADGDGGDENREPSPKAAAPSPTRPFPLATRKRLDTRTKTETDNGADAEKVPKRASLGAAPPNASGKQDPRYLEVHELLPLKDPKQDAARVVNQIRSDDWEVTFEALNIVRRLAAHHPKMLEDKIHAAVTEILKQVHNLRSSVTKNSLLALDSLCSSFGKLMDSEVDNVIPVLMKRCTDSNSFVCESTSFSIDTVILHCSTTKVVHSIAAHLSCRAVPIRKEVARSMHTVIVSLADQVPFCKELGAILHVVGKCLEDSNNEVRDAAKQSIVYLYNEQAMDADKLKKLLPSSVHGKVDSLLSGNRAKPVFGIQPRKADASKAVAATKEPNKEVGAKQAARAPAVPNAASRKPLALDGDLLAALTKKLDSSNWKDRFDGLHDAVDFVLRFGPALSETGKLVSLFDPIMKRMEDGNAKVSTLALEVLPSMLAALGNGMELVLQTFVPVVAKGLAASNPKQAALAHAAIQSLCASVDARLLCHHFAAVARHANSRIKPSLIEVLDQLAASGDEKTQFALTRYVLPLALDLLKEAKSEVKDVNARLLRTLHQSLGPAIFTSSSKLSTAQQERLAAILGITRGGLP